MVRQERRCLVARFSVTARARLSFESRHNGQSRSCGCRVECALMDSRKLIIMAGNLLIGVSVQLFESSKQIPHTNPATQRDTPCRTLINNACEQPKCSSISAEKTAVDEKKVSYLEIISYRSNGFRRSTCRPACPTASRCHVVPKPRDLFPQPLISPQFPVGVEKRLSDSSCRTAGSCGDTPSISCTWNSDETLPSLFMLS